MSEGYFENKTIDIDFRNRAYLKRFIEAHKDEKFPLTGTNDRGELVIISAVKDNVDVATCQKNDYMMHHTYWLSGEVEEWFES